MIAVADSRTDVDSRTDAVGLDYPGQSRVDPVTGWDIPRDWRRNVMSRKWLIESGDASRETATQICDLCEESTEFFLNYFCWTYNVRTVSDNGRETPARISGVPFSTWPIQDIAVGEVRSSIDEQHDIVIDKSRDMGASWLVLAVFVWYWLFRPDSLLLLVSRVEDLVDKSGNPDCLFWKLDYLIEHLPAWLLPVEHAALVRGGKCRSHMHLKNPLNGSSIDGQATTEHIARGGRRLSVLFDEMASMSTGGPAWASAADATGCRIANSTPIGPGTEYSRQRNRGVATGAPRVVTLGYWNHPGKGRQREWRVDESGETTGQSGRGYWWSPWFAEQVKRRGSHVDIGRNVLIDHETSGATVLDFTSLSRLRQGCWEGRRGTLPVLKKIASWYRQDADATVLDPRTIAADAAADRWQHDDDGKLTLWGAAIENGRPLQTTNWIVGCDPSQGVDQANTCLAVMDATTGAIVAEYVDASVKPHEAAMLAMAIGYWFGGQVGCAFQIWEQNGPGISYGHEIVKNNYTWSYFQRSVETKSQRASKRYGWTSTGPAKELLFDLLDKSLRSGEFSTPSREGCDEMAAWVHDEYGRIVCGTWADESSGAQARHGDRAIAYALCVLARRELPQYRREAQKFPVNTYGHILGMHKVFHPEPQRASAFSMDS